jgi:hypothetical protein
MQWLAEQSGIKLYSYFPCFLVLIMALYPSLVTIGRIVLDRTAIPQKRFVRHLLFFLFGFYQLAKALFANMFLCLAFQRSNGFVPHSNSRLFPHLVSHVVYTLLGLGPTQFERLRTAVQLACEHKTRISEQPNGAIRNQQVHSIHMAPSFARACHEILDERYPSTQPSPRAVPLLLPLATKLSTKLSGRGVFACNLAARSHAKGPLVTSSRRKLNESKTVTFWARWAPSSQLPGRFPKTSACHQPPGAVSPNLEEHFPRQHCRFSGFPCTCGCL